MSAALIEGAADGGADVLDLGLVGTEMVYYAVGELGLEGGVCVTASHNPKQYTGMKIVRRGALPVGGESGLLDVRDRALEIVSQPATVPARRRCARRTSGRGSSSKVLSFVDVDAIKPLKRGDRRRERDGGRDAAAGARAAADRAVTCFFEPDGSFPNHEPNPLLPENREFIIGKTIEEQRRPRGRLRRRRRPLLLRRRHGRLRPRRLRHGPARGVDPREGARRQGHLRRPREPRRAGDDRARRRRRR